MALSGGNDATVRLWDLQSGKEVRRFDGHTEAVTDLAFSPDGKQAFTCAHERSIRQWDVTTGQVLRVFPAFPTAMWRMALSPDGQRLLTGTGHRVGGGWAAFDQYARLLDVATGRELARFDGGTAGIGPVTMAPDGRTALVGCNDNTIRLLKLPEPGPGQGLTPKK
jgi:WD40 repeat protein